MISYNLAPIPLWVLRDNLGFPLENGYMKTYRDTVRSQFKPVYSDASGTLAYLQPIVFNAAGFQGPFYWASDENYYLEIYDFNNNLIRTIPAYNAPSTGGSGPVTNNIDFSNYIQDSQFRFMTKGIYSPVTTFEQLGVSNWFFAKNNLTATDEITINFFPNGSSVPPNNPPAYFNYTCSVAGTGELYKDLFYDFPSVFSFQNRELTLGFYGLSSTVASQVEVILEQYFGTGGSPSPTVSHSLTTFTLTSSWAQYSISGIPPSITGKTIGSNGDDSLRIVFRLHLDAITSISLTNMQMNDGNQLLQFNYLTPINEAFKQIPDIINYKDVMLTIDNNGYLNWTPIAKTGSIEAIGVVVPVGTTYSLLPFTPTFDPFGWISGYRLHPTFPCVCLINACYIISATAGSTIEVVGAFNFTNRLSGMTQAPNPDGRFTFSTLVNFNGTTDVFDFQGRLIGSGTGTVELIFCFIQIL